MISTFLRWIKYITYLLIFLFVIGAIQQRPVDFIHFLLYIKVVLACYLLYRFSSVAKYTEFDRKMVYGSAVFILISSFIEYINYFIDEIRKRVTVYTVPLLNHIRSFTQGSQLALGS